MKQQGDIFRQLRKRAEPKDTRRNSSEPHMCPDNNSYYPCRGVITVIVPRRCGNKNYILSYWLTRNHCNIVRTEVAEGGTLKRGLSPTEISSGRKT